MSDFFTTHTKATQQECNERAAALIGASVIPIPMQGAFSYTVVGGFPPVLVQFRIPDSDINIKLLDLAQSIHGNIIPRCVPHGSIGHSDALSIYVIEKLPGITYMESCIENCAGTVLSFEEYQRQKNTIEDFARFFGASWKNPQSVDARSLQDTFANKLQLLAEKLPSRFSTLVSQLQKDLTLLFSEGYPSVLTHGDLTEMNFLVDPETAHITGIIDWAEAEILPFGCALWGLESVLGFMDMDGWHYFDRYKDLEDLFWRTLNNTIGEDLQGKRRILSTARKVGILIRYGFRWDKDGQKVVMMEKDSGIKYLDAFLNRE